MTSAPFARRLGASLLAMALAACATASKIDLSTAAPSPDPRVGLKAGWMNAAEASWNLHLVSTTPPSADFINKSTPGNFNLINSDIAFSGQYVIQGNFSGYQVWDISKPSHPTLRTAYVCPGSQSDVSVYKNLMFVSGEATNGRTDCGIEGIADTVSTMRARGIRIFDITDITHPRPITIVQTCRGSHTNTLVTPPDDPDDIYIYVSGSAPVRSPNELAGCEGGSMTEDSNTALFRIEVIKVPLAHPEQAAIVSSPRIFNDLAAPARHGETPADSAEAAQRRAAAEAARVARGDTVRRERPAGPPPVRTGPTQCHDITAYPGIGLAGGACAGYGLLLDIHDAAHPVRIGAVADSNFSFWHSATFNNDGTKLLFSDEWGGGLQPRCRITDKHEWGADAIFTLAHDTLTFQSYYKMPAPQTSVENCVAHNGSLVPIPGRDIMVQGWYQGGISVFDWTDAAHPREIAFFDRGPMDATKLEAAGSWSAYWYNGLIVSSEISRGLDIFRLQPSGFISQNEIDAANTVHFDFLNVQDQPKLSWPPSFALARAYLDQLARDNGLAADRIAAVRTELARIEKLPAAARHDPLSALATALHTDARSAADQMKAHTLAGAIGALADAQR